MSDYYWSNGGLRRDTNEDIEYVFKYLKKNNIKFKDTRNSNTYITIFNKQNKKYQYCYTTGRWRRITGKGVVKFYHSKGIEDFVNKYLNKFVGENKNDRQKLNRYSRRAEEDQKKVV